MNKAKLSGELVQNWYYSHRAPNGEDFFENEILVLRNSGKTDRIQLICSSVLIDHNEDYSGKLVEITGDIRLYRDSKENPEKYARLFVKTMDVCTSIIPTNEFELEGTLGSVSPMMEDEFGSTIYFRLKVNKSATAYEMINCAAYNRNAVRIQKMEYGTPIKVSGRLAHFWAKGVAGEKVASFRCNANAIIEGGETNEESSEG